MVHIYRGLEHMHKHNIMHRDIKAENIFMNPNTMEVMISNFSFAVFNDQQQLKKGEKQLQVGTLVYMAPEVIRGQYDTRVDVYSAATLNYFMNNGRFLIKGRGVNFDLVKQRMEEMMRVPMDVSK